LEMPKADITVSDGSWLVLTANSGVYYQKRKFLNLEGAVNLFHDSGYEFKTKKAHIDLNQGIAISNEPVKGQGPFGQLQAEGFQIENKGNKISFLGKSKLILFPKALKGK
ncbi:MAG TPA: LPS export ABC transporter periplasmic protein LptC, partial [Rhodospirillales bacterium]|nr:LPS export ABC transporter periplasmic protein LptC [Rhodospirillales bacterium]